MAKLENYNGSVQLMAGITQKGGGDFALIDANAVQTREDGTRLDAELQEIHNSTWDHIITTEDEFDEIEDYSGHILVHGMTFTRNHDLTLQDNTFIEFRGCFIWDDGAPEDQPVEIKISAPITWGIHNCTVRGGRFVLAASDDRRNFFSLTGMDRVTDVRIYLGEDTHVDGRIQLYQCRNISDSDFTYASYCTNISNCRILAGKDGTEEPGEYGIDSCININGLNCMTDTTFFICKHISNVHIDENVESKAIHYEDCLYVDGDTCDGFYTDEDAGKINVITSDGTKTTISVWDHIFTTEDELDNLNSDLRGKILIKSDGTFTFTESRTIVLAGDVELHFDGEFTIKDGVYITIETIEEADSLAKISGGIFKATTSNWEGDAGLLIKNMSAAHNIRTVQEITDLSISFINCYNISECDFCTLTHCHCITNCNFASNTDDPAGFISGCSMLSVIDVKNNSIDWIGENKDIFVGCRYLSNISEMLGYISSAYNDYIDYDTCSMESHEWNYIVTTEDEFDEIERYSGHILVHGMTFTRSHDLTLQDNTYIEFKGVFDEATSINIVISAKGANSDCQLVDGVFELGRNCTMHISGMTRITNLRAPRGMTITFDSCRNISDSDFSTAYGCTNITNCRTVPTNEAVFKEEDGSISYFAELSDCKNVNGIECSTNTSVESCAFVSNIYSTNDSYIRYSASDMYVDASTCRYYTGQYSVHGTEVVPFIDVDGTINLNEVYTKEQSDARYPIEPGIGENSIQQNGTNAQALGDRSVAFNDTIAGCKGYRYKAIDLANHIIYLTENEITYSDTELDCKGTLYAANIYVSTTGFTDEDITNYQLIETISLPYVVGDVFTLKTRSTDYDNMGTITKIENNAVTYKSGTALDTLTSDVIRQNDTYIDRYSFSVPAKARLGHIVVSEDATAFGTEGTSAIGRFSFAAGRDNLAYGDTSTVFGRGNIAGYGSFVAGEKSKGLGDRNFTFGYSCRNKGGQAFITGHSNTAEEDAAYALVGGRSNHAEHAGVFMAGRCNGSSKAEDQIIIGAGADVTEDMILAVGNAEVTVGDKNNVSVATKSNAFVVYKDGRATIGAEPQGDMDIVNKGYLDDVLKEIEEGLGDIITAQETLIGGDAE